MRIPGIKRMYTFMLESFLPLFVMTFFITLFIVLMQVSGSYIDDLVGMGRGVEAVPEVFSYDARTRCTLA